MIAQTKRLKDALKSVGAKTRDGKTPSVRVERNYIGHGQYEYGRAVSHTAALTENQVSDLKSISEYFHIYNDVELGFAVVQY